MKDSPQEHDRLDVVLDYLVPDAIGPTADQDGETAEEEKARRAEIDAKIKDFAENPEWGEQL